jgi:hypothetical protein
MKILLIILSFLFNFQLFAQFQEQPKSFKKIFFVYQQKSTIAVDSQGFYADTLILKVDYPNLKYELKQNPKKANEIYGFVAFKNLKNDDRNVLLSRLYHENQIFRGVYDSIKNRTTISVERDDLEIKEIFKKLSQWGYEPFKYKIIVDYNKKIIRTIYPRVDYKFDFSEKIREISFDENSNSNGYFKFRSSIYEMTNRIELLPNYSNKITTGDIFTNNEFAVKKITSLWQTEELLSISFQ